MDSTQLFGQFTLWLLTLMVFSILVKENRLYRFAEHTYVALAIGHTLNMGLDTLRRNVVSPMVAGKILLVIPVAVGLLMYARLYRKYDWLARFPISLLVGVSTGVAVTGAVYGQLLSQLASTMRISLSPTLDGANSILILIFVISGLVYFTFSREHTGPLSIPSQIGRYVLLAAFGAQFAGSIALRLGVFLSVVKMLVEFPLKILGVIP